MTYTKEQQKANRAKWIKKLRSGEYRQGEGYLHSNSRYCCLGVACEVAIESGVSVERKIDKVRSLPNKKVISYDGNSEWLPEAVLSWLGIQSSRGEYNDDSLSENNDSGGYTFQELADLIESEPDGLCV